MALNIKEKASRCVREAQLLDPNAVAVAAQGLALAVVSVTVAPPLAAPTPRVGVGEKVHVIDPVPIILVPVTILKIHHIRTGLHAHASPFGC